MDIQIAVPIKFSLNVLEFDEYIPSIKALIRLEVVGFKYNFSSVTTIWIECAFFDRFVSCLKERVVAVLSDVAGGFELKVDCARGNVSWDISESDSNGGSALLKGSRPMSPDEVACLVSSFEEYPKWW